MTVHNDTSRHLDDTQLSNFEHHVQNNSKDENQPSTFAIAADLLWDGTERPAQKGLCVVIDRSRIQDVCSIEQATKAGIPIEFHHGCILPGLIDAHVHMEFSEHHPLHEQPPLSPEELFDAMADRALRMLQSGITTARDLGGRNFAALTLRDAIARGSIPGPRLLCAGQPLTTPGGHCHQWGGVVASNTEAKAVIERQVKHGVDWIKIMATGGMRTPGTNVELAQFTTEGLEEMIRLSNACGLPVAAHAHGAAGVVAAVAAGCRTVEHCTWIGRAGEWGCVNEATVSEMARKGISVAPTAHANWVQRPMGEKNYQRMSAALKRLKAAGVNLLASSDAGAIPGLRHDVLAGGIEVLAEMAELRPIEALRAATSTSAEALGLGEVCGRLAKGLAADVLIVDGDPSVDLRALRRPLFVFAEGRRIASVPPPPRRLR